MFFPTTCTSTQDIDLVWDDFLELYNLTYSSVTFLEHAIARFSILLHFLDSWVVYMEEKGIPLVGLERTPPSY
jgi:hypothetical protein